MLKFIHFSDSHLGYTDLDATNDSGLNIREYDFYDAFSQSVDIIIEEKPDFVLHTGDLFHRASPSNRSLIFAAKELQRITSAGIPVYIIAGNHDYPKTVNTAPIHELLLMNKNLKIYFDEQYSVTEEPGFKLHVLPHINNDEKFKAATDEINVRDKNGKPEILAMHLSLGTYLMQELGERVFPPEKCSILKEFDYVAMGHWHQFRKMEKYGNVWYAGSTERTAASQTGYPMGVVRVIIDGGQTTAELLPVKLREWHVFNVEKCSEKEPIAILSELIERIKSDAKGVTADKIFHIALLDIGSFRPVTDSDIEKLFPGALYVQVRAFKADSAGRLVADEEKTDLKGSLSEVLSKEFSLNGELEKAGEIINKLWEKIESEESDANNQH